MHALTEKIRCYLDMGFLDQAECTSISQQKWQNYRTQVLSDISFKASQQNTAVLVWRFNAFNPEGGALPVCDPFKSRPLSDNSSHCAIFGKNKCPGFIRCWHAWHSFILIYHDHTVIFIATCFVTEIIVHTVNTNNKKTPSVKNTITGWFFFFFFFWNYY